MNIANTKTALEPLLKKIMVVGEPFQQLVASGGGGLSFWAQVQCTACGAWLRTQPDRSGKSVSGYTYFWTCLKCGVVRTWDSTLPPESWSIDPDANQHVPGSFPALAVWDPYAWLNDSRLPAAAIALAREGWSSLAQFVLQADDPDIGGSALLEAEAEAHHLSEPLIEAVRIKLEAPTPGRRVLEGAELWKHADDFMRDVVRPMSGESWAETVSYRITFADGYIFDGCTDLSKEPRASLSRSIRQDCWRKYLSRLLYEPEDVQEFADKNRALLSRYKLGPGRHEGKTVGERWFADPTKLADIRRALDARRNRLREAARLHRMENASEPIRFGAATLKLAALESVCEALEHTSPPRWDEAKGEMIRLYRLRGYVPDFDVATYPTLLERFKHAGAVVDAFEMLHTADKSYEVDDDEARIAKALRTWRAHREACDS